MILTDKEIRKLCNRPDPYPDNMICPFVEQVSGDGVISFGLSAAGYDLRLHNEVWVYKNTHGMPIDPKRFKDDLYTDLMFDKLNLPDHAPVTIPAHSYVLGMSLEMFSIPKDIKGRCVGKSTYARCGIIVNTTPLEPSWKGFLTIEISNSSPCPAVIYVAEGICQVEFEQLTSEPERDYVSRGGKYQNQTRVTPARVL